jgi:hypothetical protein
VNQDSRTKTIDGMKLMFIRQRESGLDGYEVRVFDASGKLIRWSWTAGNMQDAEQEARDLLATLGAVRD